MDKFTPLGYTKTDWKGEIAKRNYEPWECYECRDIIF